MDETITLWQKILNRLQGRSTKQDNHQNNNSNIDVKIEALHTQILQDKSDVVLKIEKLRNIANKAIIEIFYVPRNYWYSEIEDYENIKNSEANKKLSDTVFVQSDALVDSYRKQIELCNIRAEFIDAVLLMCESINSKFLGIKLAIDNHQNNENHVKQLHQHTLQLNQDTDNIELDVQIKHYEQIADFEIQIEQVEDELSNLIQTYDLFKYLNSDDEDEVEVDKINLMENEIRNLMDTLKIIN